MMSKIWQLSNAIQLKGYSCKQKRVYNKFSIDKSCKNLNL